MANTTTTVEEYFDPETGEASAPLPREAPDAPDPDEERPDLEAIADATARRLRGAPLTVEQMGEIMRSQKPIPIGCNGYVAKIGEIKAKGGKVLPGMRISGQIVEVFGARGRFGAQTVVVISGKYSCPAHTNASGQTVPVVADELGRRLLAIDSALIQHWNDLGMVP